MKRKMAFILIIILVFTGVGVFFIFTSSDTEVQQTFKSVPSVQEATDDNNKTGEPKQEQEKREESENDDAKTHVKTFVEDAVQSTIDYFTNKEAHIVAIGDSLTQGVGDSSGEGGYVGILDNTINKRTHLAEFENYGKRGNRSDQLLKRLDNPQIVQSIKESDIVIITIGANDIMKVLKENFTSLSYNDFAMERDDYKNRLTKIFDKINELNPKTKIYLIGFYNPFEKYFPEIKELGIIVKDWNTIGKNVTSGYENAAFIPTIDLLADTNVDLYAEDNFHPNTLGYQRIAKRVLEYLTE